MSDAPQQNQYVSFTALLCGKGNVQSCAATGTEDCQIDGLEELFAQTLGHQQIRVAILDGPFDIEHKCFEGAHLIELSSQTRDKPTNRLAASHGTHVTSVVFGQHQSKIRGIVPNCTGLIIPVFRENEDGTIAPCSQEDLAQAIELAVAHGANVINISGGQFEPGGRARTALTNAVELCAEKNVLIIAAAGNDGCECLHVPAALPNVVVVGAMNNKGEPLEFSNWDESYVDRGVLACGENVHGAAPGNETIKLSGTSFATPIVTGVAAALMSLQWEKNQTIDAAQVRRALVDSAIDCNVQPTANCQRLLAGRLNVSGALKNFTQGVTMSETTTPTSQTDPNPVAVEPAHVETNPVETPAPVSANGQPTPSEVTASGCKCTGSKEVASSSPDGIVYALGQLGFDYGSEANRDSFIQEGIANPDQPQEVFEYLSEKDDDGRLANDYQANEIIWTMVQESTPIYAIKPNGPFAARGYETLIKFLGEQLENKTEQVSLPGRINGSVTLFNGLTIPVIEPALRGMFSWSVDDLIDAVLEKPTDEQKAEIANFLMRVYHELRNFGKSSRDRALNFGATNIFQAAAAHAKAVCESVVDEETKLDEITVSPSPVGRPGADVWDIQLTFFTPKKVLEIARQVHRFAVDVTGVIPVTVGEVRSWYVR